MVALPIHSQLQSGAFVVGNVLGQGGFGITYKGGDARLRRYVALKEFFPANCVRQNNSVQPSGILTATSFEAAKRRFLEEARTLAQFKHPHVVGVYNFFEENNTAYMAMEYLQGKSLRQLVEQHGVLSEDEAKRFIANVGEALRVVHEAKLLHRDIKPDNVVLSEDNRPVLIDFGLTKKLEESVDLKTRRMTGTSQFVSEGYAPPEQYLRHSQFGAYSDVYALGATLFFLLTGQDPLSAPDRMYAGISDMRVPSAGQSVNNAISQAMAIRADQRPQTISDFLHLLNEQTPIAFPVARIATPIPNPSSKLPTSSPSRSSSFDTSGGAEVLIKQLSGGTYVGEENDADDLLATKIIPGMTLSGKYLSITLSRLFLNLPLKSDYNGKNRQFTILQATFQNLWDYPLSTWDAIKMIDSDEFQHPGDLCEYHEFTNLVLPGTKKTKSVELAWPELELKRRAKSRGYIWFEKLPKDIVPHRIIFSVNVFEPGQTSGWVKDHESLEFVIEDYDLVEVQDV